MMMFILSSFVGLYHRLLACFGIVAICHSTFATMLPWGSSLHDSGRF